MKKKYFKWIPSILTIILVSLLLSSCSMSFEKRRYRPGYHVDVIIKKNREIISNDHRVEELQVENILPIKRKLIVIDDSVKQIPQIPLVNVADKKRNLQNITINNHKDLRIKLQLHQPTKKLSKILHVKKTHGLRGKKIAAWIIGGLAAGLALGSIPFYAIGSFAWIFGLIMLGIALILTIVALCVRFIGAKGLVDEPFVPTPVSSGFINAGFILGIIAVSLALLAFIFSFLVYPFGIVSMSLGVVAGILAFVTMGLGFRALKDDKGIKVKLTIIFAFIALLLFAVALILLFV